VQGLGLSAQNMGDFPSARLSYLSDMSFSSVSVDTDLLQGQNVTTNISSVDGGLESLILSKSTKSLVRHSSQAIPKSMMPTIYHDQQMEGNDTRISSPARQQKHKNKESSTPTKRLRIKQRASGFFSKLLPQSSVGISSNDAALEPCVRYSFVPGDDNIRSDTIAQAAAGRFIGRSLSLGSLLHNARGSHSHDMASSPSSTTHKSTPEACTLSTASREIGKSSLTSSSQLREDSEASLLTVIGREEGQDARKDALCGFTCASSSA
jgi:hypothetical protein